MNKEGPIGAFDSGIGGLTVVKEVLALLPGEDLVYLGDTARVPYGNKSAETVTRYALESASFLLRQGIKALVVACNTASALSLEILKEKVQVPVIGVIEPGAKAAVAATKSGTIGVIGTEATVRSQAYQRAIARANPTIKVIARACPLFVPLAEEGWTENEVAVLVANAYLRDFMVEKADTLVLGCTHYPLLKGVIARVLGERVRLIDSACETAREVSQTLERANLLRQDGRPGNYQFFLTDLSPRFVEIGEGFLKRPLAKTEKVELGTPSGLLSPDHRESEQV